jgi:hypothetical protein
MAASLVHLVVISREAQQIDRELSDYHAVLQEIPENASILPLVCDQDRHGRIKPYQYFEHWHVIERHGHTPGTFSMPSYDFYEHFRRKNLLYFPPLDWGFKDFSPLDWKQLRRDFQYIIEAGDDPRADALIQEHARVLARSGKVTVYRVEPPDP